ncbi:MAG: hypothetical protein WB975_05125 [Nitrososphaeraceae archaeon]
MRESRRLIPSFNEIGIRNNRGGSKKTERILAITRYHTSLGMVYLYNLRFGGQLKETRNAKLKHGKLHIFCTTVMTKLDSAEKIFFGWFLNLDALTRSFE